MVPVVNMNEDNKTKIKRSKNDKVNKRRKQIKESNAGKKRKRKNKLRNITTRIGRNEKREKKGRKKKKLLIEHKKFQKWKRKHNMEHILRKPQAQRAIDDLWMKLFNKGERWRKIYDEMHKMGKPLHSHHSMV